MSRLRAISLLVLAVSTPAPAAGAEERPGEGRPAPVTALGPTPRELEARGPGTIFESAEAAAVDALTYAHLDARAARETDRVRGGTVYRAGEGYSYDVVHVARRLSSHRVSHSLGPRDVARFLVYPRIDDHDVNRANERPSPADRRSVNVIDPLHRPLYILHPSLAIRVYHGDDRGLEDVTSLRRPKRPLFVSGS